MWLFTCIESFIVLPQLPLSPSLLYLSQAAGPQEPTVLLKQYQRVLLQAKAYRTQTVQLQAQLRRMTIKIVRLSKVSAAEGTCC